MRKAEIRKDEVGRIIIEDRDLVRKARTEKKKKRKAKANRKLEQLTKQRGITHSIRHLVCNGCRTNDTSL